MHDDNYLGMKVCINAVIYIRFVEDKGRQYCGKIIKVNHHD